mmetsp:Transcript_26730/g.70240  ORF Transcript_26730/g.70240 Transcript_26730/m.70240 type:complete len:234 (-) Transcript_26730:236-937(-)
MAFPAVLDVSVLVATCARISFNESDASVSSLHRILSRRIILHCRKGSVTPFTSCSGEYPVMMSPFSRRFSVGTMRTKCVTFSGDELQISVMSVTPVIRTPWFFSPSSDRVAGTKLSIRSGTLRMIRTAQSTAFFRMYEFADLSSFSTSDARSRAMSFEQMVPSVHRANPDTYCIGWFRSFLRELVMSIETSFNSSSSNIAPRYPIRLSLNRLEVTSLRHSSCPKWAGYPSMWT